MDKPSTKVPTAREAARNAVHGELNGTGGGASECLLHDELGWSHGFRCELLTDAVTLLLESRDTTLRSAVEAELAEATKLLRDAERALGNEGEDTTAGAIRRWLAGTGEKR